MRKRQFNRKTLVFLCVILLCVIMMAFSALFPAAATPVTAAARGFFRPMQNGINAVGTAVSDLTQLFVSKQELIAENEELQAQVDELTELNNRLTLDTYELTQLKELYGLDQEYSDYEKIGAYVIAKDSGNWYSTFTINRGTSDGVAVNMNVIADSGLVGIVTAVTENTATVRAVIDSSSDISAMILSTQDNCIVTGSLSLMNEEQAILFTDLKANGSTVETGYAVVTSYISDKYLPGLLIGYVKTIEEDAGGLTRSGTITPVVDFEHINEVLVITDLKETAE